MPQDEGIDISTPEAWHRNLNQIARMAVNTVQEAVERWEATGEDDEPLDEEREESHATARSCPTRRSDR